MRTFPTKCVLALVAVGGLLFLGHSVFVNRVREAAFTRKVEFVDSVTRARHKSLTPAEAEARDRALAAIDQPSPFEEIEPFDEEAWSWSNGFSLYGGAGVTVFDANGDGLPDVYFCQDGENWTRPTDKNGVLLDGPRLQCNVLYINQGNDAANRPRFVRADVLAAENATYQAEELLIENYLVPRTGAGDSRDRVGRKSNVALAADFNGDGLLDLLVGNEPPGMYWSHPKTQALLTPFASPVERQAQHSKISLAGLGAYLVKHDPQQSIHDTRSSGRGTEPVGANSLYLNRGDKDGDGLPEWEDVSRSAGIEGCRPTYGLAAADIDCDGDLDVYEANIMDSDYWPGGSRYWAGGANCLYLNQLGQTGELRFEERGREYNVDGVFDDDNPMPAQYRLRRLPFLPAEYSLYFLKPEAYYPDLLVINEEPGEAAEISWATVFQDVNDDGYPDLWVANDLGELRLYINREGTVFENAPHARTGISGMWMTFVPSDLDGDLREDLFAGNFGGGMFSNGFITPDPYSMFEPVIQDSVAFQQFYLNKANTTHIIIDGRGPANALKHRVSHSIVMPPDTTLPNNRRNIVPTGMRFQASPFSVETIDPYEFAWGAASIDVQNDGRPDLYLVGGLYSRGAGLFSVIGTNPGRLLVNAAGEDDGVSFIDLTAEYHAFNIDELKYDRLDADGYVYRRSPAQNWRKRDIVYSYDQGTWISEGPEIAERVTNFDLIQTAENGKSAIAADLNGDGFEDLLITNQGGYDSRSPTATNLKVMMEGRALVLPAPDNNYYSLTNFEPGRPRVLMNTHTDANWIKVRLIDDTPNSHNRFGVGARIIVNRSLLRVVRAGNGSFLGNAAIEPVFGLGRAFADTIEVIWPDLPRSRSVHSLASLSRGTLVVRKGAEASEWQPLQVSSSPSTVHEPDA